MIFFLVDRIEEVRPGEMARGVKNVTLSEDVFRDHFPDHPVFPGTLVVESMAQLCGFLFEYSVNLDPADVKRAILIQIEKAKFHKPIMAGDSLRIEGRFLSRLADSAQFEAVATVDGEKAARATLTFTLRRVDSENVHRQRRDLYSLWTRNLRLEHPIL